MTHLSSRVVWTFLFLVSAQSIGRADPPPATKEAVTKGDGAESPAPAPTRSPAVRKTNPQRGAQVSRRRTAVADPRAHRRKRPIAGTAPTPTPDTKKPPAAALSPSDNPEDNEEEAEANGEEKKGQEEKGGEEKGREEKGQDKAERTDTEKAEEADDDEDDDGTELTYGGEVDLVARSVWRGTLLNSGPALVPATSVTFHGVTLSALGNFVLAPGVDQGRFNLVDIDLGYSGVIFHRLTLEPTLQGYIYPYADAHRATLELAMKLSCALGAGFSIVTEHAVDLAARPGAYYGTLGLAFSRRFRKSLFVEATLYAGLASWQFNDAFWSVSKTTLDNVGAELAVSWYPIDVLFIRPHVEVSFLVDADLRAQADVPDIVAGGIAVGVEF